MEENEFYIGKYYNQIITDSEPCEPKVIKWDARNWYAIGECTEFIEWSRIRNKIAMNRKQRALRDIRQKNFLRKYFSRNENILKSSIKVKNNVACVKYVPVSTPTFITISIDK